MKKFWKIVGGIFEWFVNIVLTVILVGGGAYVIYLIFF